MPSLVRTAIILSVVLSLVHSISGRGGRCCPGDNICSGCWMCEGSNLRNCWDKATAMPSKCEAISDLQKKAACYCKAYAAIAKCWGAGTCCTEYAPTLAVATDLCNLASWPSDQISEGKIKHCVAEARRVADAIWHNDSGVDVPKAQSHIQPYTGGPVATGIAHVKHHSGNSHGGSYADPPPPTSSQNHYHKHKPHHHSGSHSHKSAEKKKKWAAKQKKWKEHHHQDKTHKGRDEGCRDKKNHAKRASYTTLNLSPSEMQDMRLGKRSIKCGIDFQGVAHPDTVPDLVQKAYDEI
ncbi:hypothetical protein DFH28DRAFT_323257 [Melampsora americana]|nr:hypothetical protein DFH28DRAFT_323257 [Melampsora americana]